MEIPRKMKCMIIQFVVLAVAFAAAGDAVASVEDAMRGPVLREVRLVKEGAPDIKAKVCDFQSAADFRFGNNFTWFSIWF